MTSIACLLLEPFALWHAERGHPGVPVAVVEGGKIKHANTAAVRGGIKQSMALHAALSRVPDLAVELLSSSILHAAWDTLVESLFAYSPKIEPVSLGRAFLTLREEGARELAAAYHARVGVAENRETALLAALVAITGEVRVVPDAALPAFLRALPVYALGGAGLGHANLHRLRVLGVERVGELFKWSKAQQAAFLGEDAKVLKPYLFGPRNTNIVSYRPAPYLEAGFDFEDLVCEPAQLEPVVKFLSEEVFVRLGGKQVRRLVLRARTPLGWLEGTREVKAPLKDASAVFRLALLALHDSGAAPLGVDRLELALSGLLRPGRQIGLWPDVRELDAVGDVLRRFPNALVRVYWRNQYAYASDARYEWVDWQSGKPRSKSHLNRATPIAADTPAQTTVPRRTPAFPPPRWADGGSA